MLWKTTVTEHCQVTAWSVEATPKCIISIAKCSTGLAVTNSVLIEQQCCNAAVKQEETIEWISLSSIFLEAVTQKAGLGIWSISKYSECFFLDRTLTESLMNSNYI